MLNCMNLMNNFEAFKVHREVDLVSSPIVSLVKARYGMFYLFGQNIF